MGNSAENLADQRSRRIAVRGREVSAICGEDAGARAGELVDDDLVDHEVTR